MKKLVAALTAATAALAIAAPAAQSALGVNVTTQTATDVTSSSATLRGVVVPTATATVFFQYGPTASYGSQTASDTILSVGQVGVAAAVSGLQPGAVYHYRLVAQTLLGTAYGADQSFQTSAPGASNSQGQDQGQNNGNGNGNGGGHGNGGAGDDGRPLLTLTTTLLGTPIGTTSPVKPQLGQSVVTGTESGSVEVKVPGSDRYALLAGQAPVPVGSVVDASRGTVQLVTALRGGKTQTASFHGSRFQVKQSRSGVTDIILRGGHFAACGPATHSVRWGDVHAASRSRVVRRLWGHDSHGHFRTRGSNSVASVRGTTWVTTDRCDGTLTHVISGAVAVRDNHTHRTVLVHAGGSYLARSR